MTPARRQRWQLAARLLDALPEDEPVHVLDVGCEDGLFTVDLAARRPAWRVVGVDVAEWALRDARAEARRQGVRNALFVRADGSRPYADGRADALVALECLAEIPDDAAALGAMARALRPGGLLVVHVPTADWAPVLRGSAERWHREVRHGYAADEVAALVEAAGFTDVRVRPSMRGTVTLAQELRDRVKHWPGRYRAPLYPLVVGAALADTAGATWGPPRGLLVSARRA